MIVGDTSTRDGWGRLRRDLGLRPLLPPGVHTPGLHAEQHVLAAGTAMPETAAAPESTTEAWPSVPPWAPHGRGGVLEGIRSLPAFCLPLAGRFRGKKRHLAD